MRHLHSGRKLGVAPDHRRAMLRSLTLALIEKETIQTLPSRAKELRWYADRVITLAKKGDIASRRQIVKLLGSTETYKPGENRARMAIEKIYEVLVPRFAGRTGGYTQMFRLVGRRPGDNAEQCVMRYIPEEEGTKKATKSAGKAPKKEAKAKASDAAPKEKKADKKAASKSEEPQDKPKAKKKDK